jgi:hypothetical protein
VELEQMKAEAQREKDFLLEKKKKCHDDFLKETEKFEESWEFNEKTLYYKRKYPFLKFITEEQLDRICKKNNLAYAPAGNYTGSIPDRNLAKIESARIDKEDLVVTTWIVITIIDDKTITKQVISEEKYKEKSESGSPRYSLYKKIYTKKAGKEGLFIAADKSMLNLEGLEKSKSGFGFFEKHKPKVINPDPVVFCHVKGGVLIITKWGEEANGPELVVPELN